MISTEALWRFKAERGVSTHAHIHIYTPDHRVLASFSRAVYQLVLPSFVHSCNFMIDN